MEKERRTPPFLKRGCALSRVHKPAQQTDAFSNTELTFRAHYSTRSQKKMKNITRIACGRKRQLRSTHVQHKSSGISGQCIIGLTLLLALELVATTATPTTTCVE